MVYLWYSAFLLCPAIADVTWQRESLCLPWVQSTLWSICTWCGGSIGSDTSVKGDSVANLTASSIMLIKCQNVRNQARQTRTLSSQKSSVTPQLKWWRISLERGNGRVWTYGHVILTLHVCPLTGRARGALVEHYGCCAVSDGGWCSKTHGHVQQEEGAQIRDSFCEREDGLTGRRRARCVVIKAVWCSARRKYAQPWYNVSLRVCVFVCLHVD